MNQFTSSVTAYLERGADHLLMKPPTSYGVIVVRPPVEPGDMFREVVLGRERCLVDVRLLFKTGRATVFLAESSIEDQNDRHKDIEDISRRIGELANNPDAALRMMEEHPFAEPQAPEPDVEAVNAYEPPQAEPEPEPELSPVVDLHPVRLPINPPPISPPPVAAPTIKIAQIDNGPTSRFGAENMPWPPRSVDEQTSN